MATLRKRGNRWQVQVRRGGFRPVSRTFDQQRDAERWGVLKERECDALESQGLLGATRCDLTLAQLLSRYRKTVAPLKRGGAREAYLIQAVERQAFTSKLADRVTMADIKAHRDARLLCVAPASVAREMGLIQHAYEVARREWGFDGLPNPVRDVAKPKLPQGRTRRLGADEERKLIETGKKSRNPSLLPVMRFALETAMRLSEITGACWEHYDPAERVLAVPVTKNGKPRTVALSLGAVAILDRLGPLERGAIFSTSTEAIKRAWIRLTRRAGIADLHFHDLRHEAVSRLFELGLDLPDVMMMSGHTDHRMLLRYTHLKARRLIAKLDRVA